MNVSLLFNEDKVEWYRLDIRSEVELRFEKLTSLSTPSAPLDSPIICPSDEHCLDTDPFDQSRVAPDHQQASLSSIPTTSVPEVSPVEESDLTYEQEIECARECLLKDSFVRSEFHGGRFLSLAETVTNKLFSCSDEKTNTFKARVITSLLRKISIILSLSKTQNEQLLSFWKTMVIFINPRNEEIANKIHASYSTCLRQCLRDQMDEKRQCQQYMKDCSHFSIALDSALIRRAHVLSCFARFAINEPFIQVPLFSRYVLSNQERIWHSS